jgi:hypothetical protein
MIHQTPKPGDVIAVRNTGFASAAIRLGAALRGVPNLANHIAVVHHTDAKGTLWVLEGRPGGVGWQDASRYLNSPWSESNVLQSKTDAQRTAVTKGALALIGTPYDWAGIVADGAADLNLSKLWHPAFNKGPLPGHVVCSSLAAYLYDQAGLDCPKDGRECQPGDWTEFIDTHGYNA